MIEKFRIGIDIVNVNRFESKSYSENKEFYKKIFNPDEIKYCLQFKNPYPHFAGKFALKEAVTKALQKNIDFLEIDTFHKNQVPQVSVKNQNYASLASISHENNTAVAVFLIELS